MRVLVTGGAGFIGSHLIDLLQHHDHEITVLDDLSTGRRANLADALADARAELELIEGSILDETLVDDCVKRAELVFHLAAAVGVRHIVDRPLESLVTNVRGTEHVLDACARYGCKVLVASSSEVYGKTATLPMSEDDDRVLGSTSVPRWSYATAKAIDEHLALAYAERGLPVSIVRYFNAYGPRIDPRGHGSVLANFIRQAMRGEPITVHGDGTQTRCFTYVGDAASGTYLAATIPAGQGQVFNIGRAHETSIAALAELVRAATGGHCDIVSVPYERAYGERFEDTMRRVPDVTKAERLLGWRADVELSEGIERTLAWWSTAYRG